jgi:hypothetical protein
VSFALQPTHLIPVEVIQDWSDADLAAEDVILALETSFPGLFQFPALASLVITGVQLQGGVTAVGRLTIAGTTAAGTWTNSFGGVPAVGSVAYIVDIY